MVDNSAGSMISSATGIFLSFLHAKVERKRLVYFIVSYHIVLNLYFINESVQICVGLNIKSLLVTFFTSKTLTAYFGILFVLSRTALFNVTIARLNKTNLVSFHVK